MKILILENIRSAYNVGAIFRTADAAGVAKIYLVGYTPTPIDRFGRTQNEIKKTSLGASESIPWEHVESTEALIPQLQQEAVEVVAVEQMEGTTPMHQYAVPKNVAYILGNEVEGISQHSLQHANTIIEIPMLGMKESLNVSVAAGIILYHGWNEA